MLLVLLAYMLLAVRVTVSVGVNISGTAGSCSIRLRVLCFSFVRERNIDPAAELKRYLKEKTDGKAKRKRKPKLVRILRAGRIESAFVRVRAGFGDAAATAVAAGGIRAALLSAAAVYGVPLGTVIEPDFASVCFLLDARGIYSFQPGDIILAAAAARIQKWKEGFGWKSILLRA